MDAFWPGPFCFGGKMKMTTLRWARFISQYTQQDLQRLSGIHQTTISTIERGQMKPSPDQREKLARALDVPVYELEFPMKED